MSNTLAWRVTWAMTATVALFVGLMAVLAFSIMYEQEDELADQLLQVEMQHLLKRLERGEINPDRQPIEAGPRTEAWVQGHDGHAAMPAPLRGLSAGPHELVVGNRVLHAAVSDSAAGRLTVVLDATGNERRVSQFGLLLFLLWSACVVAGYWLARAAAGIVVGRMHAITERIAGWDPDSSKPKDVRPVGSDEAGRLLEAFNRMQDRVDRSIAREREFSANLSHEVRTPLAALRSDIEMAGLDPEVSAQQRQRLLRMADTLDEVSATISAARAMSQPRELAKHQAFKLHALVDDVCNSLDARATAAGLRMNNVVDHGETLLTDRYALLIVLRNLIGNAIDHAAPASLHVDFRDRQLLISDDGPGISPEDLPFVFERYHRGRLTDQIDEKEYGTGEHGLGLAIARRVCEQQGWQINVNSNTSGAQRGTRFCVAFDEIST